MKIITLILINLSLSSIALTQTIKEIKSTSSIQFYNESGDMIKMISYPNTDYSEEWTYEYSKDSNGRLITATTSVYGTKIQTVNYEYEDTLTIKESIHQLTKFGITVSNIFKTYDDSGRIKTYIEIDSLQNDTTKTIAYNYNSDTLVSIELTKSFKTIIKEYNSKDNVDELDSWISGLNSIKANYGQYNHMFLGHNGTSSEVNQVIDNTVEYLTTAQGLIKGTKTLSNGSIATTVQEVIDELLVLYPDYELGSLNFALPDAFFPGDPGADWF